MCSPFRNSRNPFSWMWAYWTRCKNIKPLAGPVRQNQIFPRIQTQHRFQIIELVSAFSFVVIRLCQIDPFTLWYDVIHLHEKLFFLPSHLSQLIAQAGYTDLLIHAHILPCFGQLWPHLFQDAVAHTFQDPLRYFYFLKTVLVLSVAFLCTSPLFHQFTQVLSFIFYLHNSLLSIDKYGRKMVCLFQKTTYGLVTGMTRQD